MDFAKSFISIIVAVYEVVTKLERHGIGHKVQRTTWKEDSFWTITGIKPSLVSLLCLLFGTQCCKKCMLAYLKQGKGAKHADIA